MAWALHTTPDRILDMDAALFELYWAYCVGRTKGEAIRAKRRL